MSRFITDLIVRNINDVDCDGRGIWEIVQPFTYESNILGKTITVEPGFLTDFASVPRIPFIYDLLGDTSHKAAVLHDWLYHHHEVCDEKTANAVFKEACIVEGISKWRLFCLWAGVAIGGKSSWTEDGNNDGHKIVNNQIA